MSISNRDYVNALARGLEVIRAFTRTTPSMTLADMARTTGMNRATVRRFLLTLVAEGYAHTDGKQFALKPKVLELGYAALSSMKFLDVVQPAVERLAEELGESCFAAILDGEVGEAAGEQQHDCRSNQKSEEPEHLRMIARPRAAARMGNRAADCRASARAGRALRPAR